MKLQKLLTELKYEELTNFSHLINSILLNIHFNVLNGLF